MNIGQRRMIMVILQCLVLFLVSCSIMRDFHEDIQFVVQVGRRPEANTPTTICRKSVDGILALHPTDTFFPPFEGDVDAEKFDVNRYFDVLDHLSMKEGYELSYVYYSEFLGGQPILYAKKIDQLPYDTVDEFLEAKRSESSSGRELHVFDHTHDYLDYVEVDGTRAGYIQFVILSVLGDQFYQVWHAAYHDEKILCDQSDVETIIAETNKEIDGESFGRKLNQHQIDDSRQLNVQPNVTIRENTVLVRIVYFTKWGGFIGADVSISRDPTRIITTRSNTLIEYDVGIIF